MLGFFKEIKMKYLLLFIILLCCSCDHFSFGEGIINYGLRKLELDGHSYIVYRAEEGCALLHDIDCERCRKR